MLKAIFYVVLLWDEVGSCVLLTRLESGGLSDCMIVIVVVSRKCQFEAKQVGYLLWGGL